MGHQRERQHREHFRPCPVQRSVQESFSLRLQAYRFEDFVPVLRPSPRKNFTHLARNSRIPILVPRKIPRKKGCCRRSGSRRKFCWNGFHEPARGPGQRSADFNPPVRDTATSRRTKVRAPFRRKTISNYCQIIAAKCLFQKFCPSTNNRTKFLCAL